MTPLPMPPAHALFPLLGIDRREQKKQLVNLERDMLRKARLAAGIEESTETRRQERERERQADIYDGFDMRVS